jgi:hypothetical protein
MVQDGRAEIKVFTFGHPDVQDGVRVEVTGRFLQENHVGPYTFYNEIDASSGSVTKAQ